MSDLPNDSQMDQIDLYLLGQMNDLEHAAFEKTLKSDPQLAAQVAAMREALAMMALSEPAPVRPEVKARLMEKITAAKPVTAVTPISSAPRKSWALPILTAALAASLLLAVKLKFDLHDERLGNAEAQTELESQRATIAYQEQLIASFTDAGVEAITLVSTGRSAPGMKTWIDRKNHRAMLTVSSVPQLEAGHSYQLWFIIPGAAPIPSVAFVPDSTGRAFVGEIAMPDNVATAGEITTAITVEPTGGSAAPTTAPIFVGKTTQKQ